MLVSDFVNDVMANTSCTKGWYVFHDYEYIKDKLSSFSLSDEFEESICKEYDERIREEYEKEGTSELFYKLVHTKNLTIDECMYDLYNNR